MIVCVPSMGRATRAKTLRILKSAVAFVPANEAEAYERCGIKNVVSVPIEVRGITATRNWIIDHARKAGHDRIVMVDDDVKACGYWSLAAHRAKSVRMAEDEWLRLWSRLFDICDGTGYPIWGVSTDGALRSVYPYKPFLWHTYVTASCMGLVANSELRFDESYPVKEDYELALRCVRDFGGVVGARFCFWANSHWGDEGGCTTYRTQDMEEDCIHRLMVSYPRMIRRVTRKAGQYTIQIDF